MPIFYFSPMGADSGRPSKATRPTSLSATCFYYIDKPIVTHIQAKLSLTSSDRPGRGQWHLTGLPRPWALHIAQINIHRLHLCRGYRGQKSILFGEAAKVSWKPIKRERDVRDSGLGAIACLQLRGILSCYSRMHIIDGYVAIRSLCGRGE